MRGTAKEGRGESKRQSKYQQVQIVRKTKKGWEDKRRSGLEKGAHIILRVLKLREEGRDDGAWGGREETGRE